MRNAEVERVALWCWGRDINPGCAKQTETCGLPVCKGYGRHWKERVHSAHFLQIPQANFQTSNLYFVSDQRKFQNILLCSPHSLVMSQLGKCLHPPPLCAKAPSHTYTAFPLRWRKTYTLQQTSFDAPISATKPDLIMCLFSVTKEQKCPRCSWD